MKEVLLTILFSLPVIVPVYIHLRRGWKRQEALELAEMQEGADAMSDRVHGILYAAYADLRRQRAAGYGPWISTLLGGGSLFISGYDEDGRAHVENTGREVCPEVARTAVLRTISELAGSRFNLDALNNAADELNKMTREGE